MPGNLTCEKEFGYQSYRSKEELTANYKRLWKIQEEINGIVTYGHDEVKLLQDDIKALNAKLYRVFAEKVTK